MVSAISLAENDDLEASDSVWQIGHLVGSNSVQKKYTVKAAKCDYDGKHQKTRSDSFPVHTSCFCRAKPN